MKLKIAAILLLIASSCFGQAGFIVGDSFSNDPGGDWPFLLPVETFARAQSGRKLPQAAASFADDLADASEAIDIHWIAIALSGVNDVNQGVQLPEMKAATLQMIKISRTRGVPIILTTVAPFKNNDTWRQVEQDRADAYSAWVRRLARSNRDLFCWDWQRILDRDRDLGLDPELSQNPPQDFHPSYSVGQPLLARSLTRIFLRFFQLKESFHEAI